uniref:CXXC-type domain-containing protein n=1 Tax=Amphimedon queenslandica TaxID=400682 RepID=A0A1X7THZ2_AMPQE
MPLIQQTRPVNLSQLRWNTRGKSLKKCGRKRPRPGDCDIVVSAAPDSQAKTELLLDGDMNYYEESPTISPYQHVENQSTIQQPESHDIDVKLKPEVTVKCVSEPSSLSSNKKANYAMPQPRNTEKLPEVKRGRCMQCVGCKSDDCGVCIFCKDKKKFGGPVKAVKSDNQKISDLKLSAKTTAEDGAETVGTSKSLPIDVETLPDKDNDPPRKYLARCPYALVEIVDFATVIDYALHYIFKEELPSKFAFNKEIYDKNMFCLLPTAIFSKLAANQADETLDRYFCVIKPQDKSVLSFDSIGGYFTKTSQAIKCKATTITVDRSELHKVEEDIMSNAYLTHLQHITIEEERHSPEHGQNVDDDEDDDEDDDKFLDNFQFTESLDVIKSEKLLIPTFQNGCDHPDDITELPYGYETCIKYYPKLARPQGNNIVFDRYFIRENVKLYEDKIRDIYLETEMSIFWGEESFLKKHDIGSTNFWPLDYFDMGLELLYYLKELESDIKKRSVAILGPVMKRIIIPECVANLFERKGRPLMDKFIFPDNKHTEV